MTLRDRDAGTSRDRRRLADHPQPGHRRNRRGILATRGHGMNALTVLVCDDDSMVRSALRDVLDAEPDFQVVAVARDTDEAISLAEVHAPAVVVLDIRMPGGGGTRAAEEIGTRSPSSRILAFSAYGDPRAVNHPRQLGVTEYLVKGASNAEIVAAVRRLGHMG
jgi:DNA-binding NarL/FixJ family response regulator